MGCISLNTKFGFILICVFWIGNQLSYSNNTNSVNIDLSQANDTLMISKISLVGNHKTKPKIILNELLFKQGQLIAKSEFYDLVGKSRQNLLKTSLFNFVYFNYWLIGNNEVAFEIKVDERWYTWVLPIFEHADRNFSSFLQNGDWSRMNYGIYLKQENFRGLNQKLKLKLRIGYLKQVEMRFSSASYNNKLSWGSNIIYYAKDQVSYGVYGDEAVYIKTNQSFIEQQLETEMCLKYRHSHNHRHRLTVGYHSHRIQDTLAILNPNYLSSGNTSLNYMSLEYLYNVDWRDSKIYPLRGTMFEASVTQSGLSLLKNNINNLAFKVQVQQHGNIYKHWYYGWNLGGLLNSSKSNPFVISNGLGYKEFLNGYEYNVIESDDFLYSKQKVLFELIPTKTGNINFINLRQFSKIHYALYLKAFFDTGYVNKENPNVRNSLSNSFLYSYGVGVDLVTYYDKVLSVNYSVNKLGVKGFYVHLNLGM